MAGGTRGGNGKFRRSADTAARDMHAAELYGQGWTFERIAAELGYASRGKAHDAVDRAFGQITTPGAEQAKKADLERLDRLIEQAWAVMLRPHVAHSNGHVIRRRTGEYELHEDGTERLDDKGQPVPVYEDVLDDGPILAAIGQIRALIERRAKVYGYEAPAKARIEVISEDTVDAELKRLETELAVNDRDHSGAPG